MNMKGVPLLTKNTKSLYFAIFVVKYSVFFNNSFPVHFGTQVCFFRISTEFKIFYKSYFEQTLKAIFRMLAHFLEKNISTTMRLFKIEERTFSTLV